MPNTICDDCRMLMEHCYRFKQMCKKADTALRQFPLTSTWPKPLDFPKLPEELVGKQYPNGACNKQLKRDLSPVHEKTIKVELAKQSSVAPNRPKLLNKNSVKILNKNAQPTVEPILSQPIIKRDDAGNVEIVTEILEQLSNYEEPDPIKTAAPVETNVFPCPHCERSFPLKQLLDIHMVNHTRERCFECQVCTKRFFSKYDLGKHMLIHTGEKPYECVVCKKAFTRSTLLHRHEKIHTDQPKFLCVYCEKPFLSKDELEKHTERHKKNRPFSCKICGKCFAFKQGLERHETVHAKVQPYPCQYCDQSFPTPSKLSRHLTAHAGARPFPCRLCPNSYLLSHHLTRHMRSHTGSGSYKCYDCEKTFKTRDDLIYHSAVHATQNLVCPLCKEQFDSLDLVTDHIKLHAEGEQYACEFCDLIFMTAEKLQAHSDTEHTEDLAAYEKHTKDSLANIKKESNNQFNEDSQDTGNEEGEVLEEFIIEEYHHDEDNNDILENSNSFVKEETASMGKDAALLATQKNDSKRSNIRHKLSTSLNRPKEPLPEEESDYPEMEVEALEGEGEEDDTEEPPLKTLKVTGKSAPEKVTQKIQKEQSKPIIQARKIPATPSNLEQLKMKQTTITSVLQQLPKSVTVIKKEKPLSEKLNSVKEIRILNEKIIKKSVQTQNQVQPKPSPENKKQIEVKPTKSQGDNNGNKNSPKNSTPNPNTSSDSKQIKATAPSSSKHTKKLVEMMMIGDRKVKVQKIMMTKAEVAAMAKEGKIEMKGGTMILKQDKNISGKIISSKKSSESQHSKQ